MGEKSDETFMPFRTYFGMRGVGGWEGLKLKPKKYIM
jgi:hypothetical protein